MRKQLWKTLLQLSSRIANSNCNFRFCSCIVGNNSDILFDEIPQDSTLPYFVLFYEKKSEQVSNTSFFIIKNNLCIESFPSDDFSADDIQFLVTYLPYCLLPIFARKNKRAFAIGHFAQSLDGKIATNSGDSKWIGNDENLIHAHRMRALCDGIVIGTNTLKNDSPKLTVRKVEGKNPQRIVIGKNNSDVSSLLEACSEPVLIIGKEKKEINNPLDYHHIPTTNGRIDGKDILKYLFQKNIYSVYIEGGAITTSNFIKDNALDILQLHISPLIFGNGRSAIQLPEIQQVKDSIQFKSFQFRPIGDSTMFVGVL